MTDETETVKVYCRLKPSNNENQERCLLYKTSNNSEYLQSIPPIQARANAKEGIHSFSGVFNEDIDQDDVYENVAYPLVLDLIDGKNSLLFAYGVTGSGKTFTMQGTDEAPGLVPRTLKSLFERINLVPRDRVVSNLRNGFKVIDALDAVKNAKPCYARLSGTLTYDTYMKGINDVFNNGDKEDNCTVFISLVEIYGKRITDLLANKSEVVVSIYEDKITKSKYLHNVNEIEVQSASEAYYWYLKGQRNRKVATTKLNSESSRSHMVFNIRLVKLNNDLKSSNRSKIKAIFNQKNCSNCTIDNNLFKWPNVIGYSPSVYQSDDIYSEVGDKVCCYRTHQRRMATDHDQMCISQLSLVDLAGSERAGKSGALGGTLKEAGDINNALMVLRRCMELLREKNRNVANKPDYRSNELTHLFKTALEGGSALRMIVCVQSSPDQYDETMNALQFAENSQEISMPVQRSNEPFRILNNELPQSMPRDQEIEVKLNEIWEFVSRTRMSDKTTVDDINDLECILRLSETFNEVWQYVGEIMAMMSDELQNNDCQDQCEDLTSKLTKERMFHANTKKQLRDSEGKFTDLQTKLSMLQGKLTERESELMNLRRTRTKQDERIKALEEEVRGCQAKMLHEQIQESDIKVGSVKAIKKMYESNISSISKKFVPKIVATPLPVSTVRKGFINPRYRRSRSQENWIEHKEKNEIPMGTLNQIKLKSKIQTKNPDLKSLRKSDKYLLHNQTVNSDADVTMSYLKGDLIPTCSGGVAMAFKDVETVTQSSPVTNKKWNKRRSSSLSENLRDSKRFKGDSDEEY